MDSSAFIYDDVCVPPDRQIGVNAHPRWEVSYVICGGGMRTIGSKTEPICEGEIILLPPDVSHIWQFDPTQTDDAGNICNISVFFDQRTIDGMTDLFPELRGALVVYSTMTEAISYTGERYEQIRGLLLAMRHMTATDRLPLMIKLVTALADVAGARDVGSRNALNRVDIRREKVRVYCACNYWRNITLDELTRHVGMNKSAFCTFMRRHMGTTFSQYLNDFRLERACEKLRSLPDCSISEIAMDCGFANVTYFNRLFKARYGLTPKAIRAQ